MLILNYKPNKQTQFEEFYEGFYKEENTEEEDIFFFPKEKINYTLKISSKSFKKKTTKKKKKQTF